MVLVMQNADMDRHTLRQRTASCMMHVGGTKMRHTSKATTWKNNAWSTTITVEHNMNMRRKINTRHGQIKCLPHGTEAPS